MMDTWDMFVKQPFVSLKVTEVSRCWNKNKHVGLEIVMFDVCFLWDNLYLYLHDSCLFGCFVFSVRMLNW